MKNYKGSGKSEKSSSRPKKSSIRPLTRGYNKTLKKDHLSDIVNMAGYGVLMNKIIIKKIVMIILWVIL